LPPHGKAAAKEHRRTSSHKLVVQYIVPCMKSYGLCIVDSFLGSKIGDRILNEVVTLHQCGKFRAGELVSKKSDQSKSIRGDEILWVEGNEPGCESIGYLLSKMDKLILYSDGMLGHYKIRGRHKVSVFVTQKIECRTRFTLKHGKCMVYSMADTTPTRVSPAHSIQTGCVCWDIPRDLPLSQNAINQLGEKKTHIHC
uniref:Uncharacterized protein n=1 Tax=Erpetoichthys calabaricus TaxID=27687 RepID=A0A8C4T0D1_ERPCA